MRGPFSILSPGPTWGCPILGGPLVPSLLFSLKGLSCGASSQGPAGERWSYSSGPVSDTTTGSRAQGLVERAVGETSKEETRVLWVRPLLTFWVPFGEEMPRARGRSWSPWQLFPQMPICRSKGAAASGVLLQGE